MTKPRKSQKGVVQEVGQTTADGPATPPTKRAVVAPQRIQMGRILWGLVLVIIGGLMLLDNLNIITVHFSYLWQLWPLLLVVAGLSMMSLRGWLAGAVVAVVSISLIALVVATTVDNPYVTISPYVPAHTQRITKNIVASNDSTEADISVKAGAAEIVLSSSMARTGVEATLQSSHMTLEQEASVKDGTHYVRFTTEGARNTWFGGFTNRLSLDITRSIPVALHIDVGASSLSGDISKVKLKSLTVKAGASSIDLKLGDASSRQEVTLDTGASSINLQIPEKVGVRVYTNNGLSSFEFAGVDKKSDGVYESTEFEAANVHIIIHTEIGISRFVIQRY